MICVVIKGPNLQEAYQQINEAIPYADLVELRLDLFSEIDMEGIKKLKANFTIPFIFTLRDKSQGGHYAGTEKDRLLVIQRLAVLNPAYFDIESHVSPSFIQEITHRHSSIQWILSYHDFTHTPEDIGSIYEKMQNPSIHIYKLAFAANSSSDTLRFLLFTKTVKQKFIAVSIGALGAPSRILGPIFGSYLTYACLDDSQHTAPGQLTAKTLLDTYRYRALGPHTAIYGLIGNPVDRSFSHVVHNQLMKKLDWNAVYIKLQVKPEEVPEFLALAKQIPFQGLSVTMNLKECVIPCIDHLDPHAKEIGAVNTLKFCDGKIYGYNTDCFGALNPIEEILKVANKKVIIIGAGGASKAIVYEACKRKAHVTVLNRDVSRAQQLSERYGCAYGGLDRMKEIESLGYGVLINCTPAEMPIDPDQITPHAIVMDIKTKPKDTPFIQSAHKKGCRVVYGYQMFIEQALGQFSLWKKDFNSEKARPILETVSLEYLR